MKTNIFAVAILTIFLVSLSHASDQSSEVIKATGAAATGAAIGGATFAAIGSGGLAIAGTAVTISAAPFVAAGTVVGLAGYGIYRVFSDSNDSKLEPPPRSIKATKVPKH